METEEPIPQDAEEDISSETIETADAEETAAPAVNPFDFTAEPEEEPPAPEKDAPDYVLDLGERFDGDDATRAMLTSAARGSGLEAGAAGKFIRQVCEELAKNQQNIVSARDQSLRDEWGGSYDENMLATGKFLREQTAKAGITGEETQLLMNPAVFKLMNSVRNLAGEAPARGVTSASPLSKQQKYDAFINDPANHAVLMDPTDIRYDAVAAAANALHPKGMRMY
ncbi:MAG: hypothetical protein LUE08_04085 [Akkermansiaceae bacterium]|nr:hypothetical protein [Akkermansiaceae bacterium]